MTEPIIGACTKHGRNLASCEECFPFGNYRKRQVSMFESQCQWDVNLLRVSGALRVACQGCKGRGKIAPRSEHFAENALLDCPQCDGKGWKRGGR